MDGLRRGTPCRLSLPFPFLPGHTTPASFRFTIIQLHPWGNSGITVEYYNKHKL